MKLKLDWTGNADAEPAIRISKDHGVANQKLEQEERLFDLVSDPEVPHR